MNSSNEFEYSVEYITKNAIPAKCKKCCREFTNGQQVQVIGFGNGHIIERNVTCNEAISAPSLADCRCFYCWGELGPLRKGGPTTVEQVEQERSRQAAQPLLQIY